MLHEKYINETKEAGVVTNLVFNIPDDFNFAYDVVDEIARTNPGKLAIMWCNESGREKRITFGEVSLESDRIASFLLSKGIKKGDPVMLILKRHYEYWFSIIALHKIGAVAIPASNQLLVKDLIYRFKMSETRAVIATPDGETAQDIDLACMQMGDIAPMRIIVRTPREGWICMDEELDNAKPFVRPTGSDSPNVRDIMLMYFTSGTTGYPKMAVHDYSYPLGHIRTAKYWQCVERDGLHLTVSDTGWAKASWGKIYGQWLMEGAIMVYDYDRFNAGNLLDVLVKYRVTTFCAPPTIFRFMIHEDLSEYDLSFIHRVTIAGEALNPEVFARFKAITGLEICEGFGQTETTCCIGTPYWLTPKPGSLGKEMPGYRLAILDSHGDPASPGVVGEISFRSSYCNGPAGLFKGYCHDEQKTDEVWHDGYYRTGDMAWKDEEGYYWYVGRIDDLIKSSGYRIGPFEVESVLMEHESVMECAITGVPDPIRGQVVKATIVLAKGFEPSDELKTEIQNYVKTHTAPYKYPRIIEFIEALPKTTSGKIQRNILRNPEKTGMK